MNQRAAPETIFQISAVGGFEEVQTVRRGGLKACRKTVAKTDDKRERHSRRRRYGVVPADYYSFPSVPEPACAVTTPAKLTEIVI